jgi:hypothetical protein
VGTPRGNETTTGSCAGSLGVTSTVYGVELPAKEACFRFLADLFADGAIVVWRERRDRSHFGGKNDLYF